MKHKGFTVLEFLIVMAIMAILVSLILVGLTTARANARDQAKIANLQKIALALQQYQDICREYPNELIASQSCVALQNANASLGSLIPEIDTYAFNTQGDYNYAPMAPDQNNPQVCSGFHLWVRLERQNNTTNAARFNSDTQNFLTCDTANPATINASSDMTIYDIYK